jgi:hypothetical protein
VREVDPAPVRLSRANGNTASRDKDRTERHERRGRSPRAGSSRITMSRKRTRRLGRRGRSVTLQPKRCAPETSISSGWRRVRALREDPRRDRGFPKPKDIPPALPPMFGRIVDHVAALTECLEVRRRAIARIMIEVRAGEDDIGHPDRRQHEPGLHRNTPAPVDYAARG